MTTNSHTPLVKQDSKSTAIVEVNSLSEDDHHVNLADHDGKNSIFLCINL
jgi:hypothetical protein